MEDDEGTWIDWFLSVRGNEYLCEIDEEYIRDRFNLTGIHEKIQLHREAIKRILSEDSDSSAGNEDYDESVEDAAALMYGLIHARYIMTSEGVDKMVAKWKNKDFGTCPRTLCNMQACLPIGTHDEIGNDTVKIYCPKCSDIYVPRSVRQKTDGAFFGTGFPHMLFLMRPQLRPSPNLQKFIPKLFGFKIHRSED